MTIPGLALFYSGMVHKKNVPAHHGAEPSHVQLRLHSLGALVWGGGFLASMGVLDFAGGLVVHLSAGTGGLGLRRPLARHSSWASLVGLLVPLRVSREQELAGLDITQHGEALQQSRLRYLNTIDLPGA